ncbi:MAG: exodeoxyribonuclease VII large subunit [Actinomycetales bacterium]
MPLTTSPEHPLPVRRVSSLIAEWIGRLGAVWVEGQVAQLTHRSGTRTAFLTLRDTDADVSLSVTCPVGLLDAQAAPLQSGARVVVHAKPSFWVARGSLSLAADDLRPVGVGELLARIEALKATLAAEGLFRRELKRQLPFLPQRVGLICGRGSAAERDVVSNARRRWPAVEFDIREVAVQGPNAVMDVCQAFRELDLDPSIDVIVIARGGGSVEDLLPFSNETLLRVVAGRRTALVSAIGHEVDTPLLDLIADVRASTPTDAASCLVPDLGEQLALLRGLRQRAGVAVRSRLDQERRQLALLQTRPCLAEPHAAVAARRGEVESLRQRGRRALGDLLERREHDLAHIAARLDALSPAATLARGYAIVQRSDDGVVRGVSDLAPETEVVVRLADGRFAAVVTSVGEAGAQDVTRRREE